MTALGAQLKALAVAQGRDTSTVVNRPRTRPSLLFDPKEAADVDLETIFSIAQSGLGELIEANKLFSPFKKTLFSNESTQTDRELQSKEFNDKLNQSISEFLRLLSKFILLSPAHQVLEYLIRRYKIHIHNVDNIMSSILPYHETTIFVRVVQLLKLEKTRWEFLKGVKHTGASPPRDVFVQRCTHDMSFLEAVCELAMIGMKSVTHITFSCVTVMETASAISTVTKEFVGKLLPFVLRAFEKGVPEEYRVGGLLIVGALASRASLTQNLCFTLLESMSKVISKTTDVSSIRLFLVTMIELIQTQELSCFPPKAFKLCVKVKELPVLVAEVSKTYNADKFIMLFIGTYAEHCVSDEYYEKHFCEVIDVLPLQNYVKLFVSKLLKSALDKEAGESDKKSLQRILSVIDKRFPAELDSCVNSLSEDKDSQFFKLLCEVFEGSLRRPMGESRCSLYSSVNHPKADVRKAAVHHISEMCKRPLSMEEGAFVSETLLRRLGDDDLEVVRTVLLMKDLDKHVPLERLLKCLSSLLHRCMEILEAGSKSTKTEAKDCVKTCLKLLESFLSNSEEGSLKEMQRCLLCYVLIRPKTWKLNLNFLRVSSQHPVLLFKALTDASGSREPEMSKEKSRMWRAEVNSKVVTALATAILQDHTLVDLLLEAAVENANAKVLSVLVIAKCFSEDTEKLHQLSQKCMPFLREEWVSIVPDIKDELPGLLKIEYASQLDEIDSYKRLEKNGNVVYTELILLSLYRIIPSFLSSSEKSESKSDIFCLFLESPVWEVTKAHILRVLERQSDDTVSFLLEYSFSQGVPALVQVHSLSILAWYFSEHFIPNEKQAELGLAGSFVALANPLKSARVAAVNCMKAIQQTIQASNVFFKLLQAIVESSENFLNDGKFLASFCNTFFEEDESDEQKVDIVTGLVEQALKLPSLAQTSFFDILHDVGYLSEKEAATRSSLFQLLERRKLYHLSSSASSSLVLKEHEVDLVDKLLEINIKNVDELLRAGQEQEYEETRSHILWALLEALDVEGGSLTDPAVLRPCLMALRLLSPELYDGLDSQFQDRVFESLIELVAVADDIIRPSTRQVIDKLQVKVATVSRHIDYLYSEDSGEDGKKKKRVKRSQETSRVWPSQSKTLTVSIGLLEFLLRKTTIYAWKGLLKSLFDLLRAHANGGWPKSQTEISQDDMYYIGQLALSVIENIIRSDSEMLQDHASALDVDLLVKYVKSKNAATRNHALAVIAVAGKQYPENVLPHVVEVLSIVSASAVAEDDGHSHTVVQDMLASIVPFWLKKVQDPQLLFQVFFEALPRIPTHRQTDLIKCVLRVANEESSIPAFLLLLLEHAKAENGWSVRFAEKLCMSYDSHTRVSTIVKLSTELQSEDFRSRAGFSWFTLQSAMRFIASQLKRLEVQLENDTAIQRACCVLMEHALRQLQFLGDKKIEIVSKSRASCLEDANLLLETVTKLMSPSVFCKTVAFLLNGSDNAIRRKVLQIYVSKLKQHDTITTKKKGFESVFTIDTTAHMDIVLEISKLLERPEQAVSHRTKQAAVSALDITVQKFGEKCSAAFVSCLPAVLTNFEDPNAALVVASVRCTASILSATGPQSLPSFPAVMTNLLKIAQNRSRKEDDDTDFESSVLSTLEAAVEKLGAFMSPYVEDIIDLVISPEYVSLANTNLAAKFAAVKSLISEKIPARLLLDPLTRSYKKALEISEASTAIVFQMLATMCSKLDRASVAACHTKIFEFCMEAFDLRRKKPESFTSVHLVEDSVISAVAALVMKLSETTFRPLFVAVQEWSLATVLDGEATGQSIDRSIVFYKLVNQLTNKLRSVFVPYFRYLLDGCLALLGKTDGTKTSKSKKKKTVHVSVGLTDDASSLAKWQLRHLVVSALQKCFLYDNVGFLDAAKFQQLLQPLAGQLLEEVPSELDGLQETDVPTVEEADEAVISCLGRMALTAGTDTLWKPLNHEVLMKSRSDSRRAKLLALSIVKFLLENLKEEYLVLIPETIPFLSELLEDQDMNIVSKTQEVIKMLEELSGESLAELNSCKQTRYKRKSFNFHFEFVPRLCVYCIWDQ